MKTTQENVKTLGLPPNRILRIYNQFPRCYVDINEMTSQLPHIAAMGFNVVWINPVQETGKEKHPLRQDPLNKGSDNYFYSGSLYATRDTDKIDDDFSVDKKNNSKHNIEDINAIKNYTETATRFGITPIFDLVLNQVAIDAEIYNQQKNWFIYPSRHFGKFCCDFNYDHPDENIRKAIMDFLKQEIRKYIVDFGFLGVRVDAAKHLPLDVQREIYNYIFELCKSNHNANPIIYAEVIAGPEELKQLTESMQDLGITHVMNSLFHERFTQDYRMINKESFSPNYGKGYWETGLKGDKNVLYGLWLLRTIVRQKDGNTLGGTIGFSGSHDYSSLYDAALYDQARSEVEKLEEYRYNIKQLRKKIDSQIDVLKTKPLTQQEQYLREKIASIAFTSDAGWYLLSGDEFGYPGRKWVFDFYHPCRDNLSFENHWGGQFDLSAFVAGVNRILANLPTPHISYWVQHLVLEKKPELMIVIRHNGDGYLQSAEIVIVNLSNRIIELSREDINEIADIASLRESSNEADKDKAKECIIRAMNDGKIFCLGNFNYTNLKSGDHYQHFEMKCEQIPENNQIITTTTTTTAGLPSVGLFSRTTHQTDKIDEKARERESKP